MISYDFYCKFETTTTFLKSPCAFNLSSANSQFFFLENENLENEYVSNISLYMVRQSPAGLPGTDDAFAQVAHKFGAQKVADMVAELATSSRLIIILRKSDFYIILTLVQPNLLCLINCRCITIIK